MASPTPEHASLAHKHHHSPSQLKIHASTDSFDDSIPNSPDSMASDQSFLDSPRSSPRIPHEKLRPVFEILMHPHPDTFLSDFKAVYSPALKRDVLKMLEAFKHEKVKDYASISARRRDFARSMIELAIKRAII